MGHGVDSVGGSSPQAYGPADPLDVASSILARDPESPNLLKAARSSAAELEAIESPSQEQLDKLAQIKELISQLAPPPPPPAEPEKDKGWSATGAARARPVTQPSNTRAAEPDRDAKHERLVPKAQPTVTQRTDAAAPVSAKKPALASTTATQATTATGANAAAKAALVAKAAAPLKAAAAAPVSTEPVAVDAVSGQATINKPMTLKALAANAFGLPEDQVGDTHLALLAQQNQGLAQLKPTDTLTPPLKVDLSASPKVAEQKLKATIKGLETVDGMLAAGRSAKPGSPEALNTKEIQALAEQRARLVEDGNALKAQLPTLRAYDAIGRSESLRSKATEALKAGDDAKAAPAMAAARKELDQALAAKDLTPAAKGVLLKRRGELSLLEASGAAQPAALTAFRDKNGGKRFDELSDLPKDIQAATNKSLASVSAGFKAAKADLQASSAAYKEQLKTATADEKPRLEGLIKELDTNIGNLAAKEQAALGLVHSTVGHTTGQMAAIHKELDAVMPGGSDLLKKTDSKRVNDDGSKAVMIGTKVNEMTPEALKGFKEKLAKLPPDQQTRALAVVAKLGEAGASNADASALNISRQLLEQQAVTDPKGPWGTQASLTNANYLLQLGNPTAAAKAFREAGTKAAAIGDPLARQAVETRAVFGEASALSAATREGNAPSKAAAAKSLTELRAKVEARQPPLLDKSSLAQLSLSEVNGLLAAHQSEAAQAALDRTKKTYGGVDKEGKAEVPWLNDAFKKFEADNREGGAAAFTQTLMNEMTGRQTAGEKAAFLAASTGIGVGVGAGFFGVGVIPGAIVGLAAGGIGLLGGNAIEGWDNARQAANTGLARESWVETLTDGVSIATDLLGVGGAIKGVTAVGMAGLSAASRGAFTDETRAIISSNMLRIERQLGSEAFAKLGKKEAEAAAQKLVLKEFSEVNLKFGGIAMPAAGLATAAGGVAKGIIDINNDPNMTPQQKEIARGQLMSGLGKALVDSLPQMAMQIALHKTATSGLPADLRKAVSQAATYTSARVELSQVEWNAKLKAAANDEIKATGATGDEAARIRAHYQAIATGGDAKVGEAFIDLGTGNVYLNKDAPVNKTQAGKAEVMRHELAHREFHQVGLADQKKLVDWYKALPENHPDKKAINDLVRADNPHMGGFTPLQVLDEYQAKIRSSSGALNGLTGGSATLNAMLQDAGLKGVKDVDMSKVDLGAFRPRSGERLAMGASGIGDNTPALSELARDFKPLKMVMDNPNVPKAEIGKLTPDRLKELDNTRSKEKIQWINTLISGSPMDASKHLWAALQDGSPQGQARLAELLAKKPAELVGTPVPAPSTVGSAVRPATPATSSPPAAVAAPVAAAVATPAAAAEAAIDALGGFTATQLKGALKKSPAGAAQFEEVAKALGDKTLGSASGITFDKSKFAAAFAAADEATRAQMTATLKSAIEAKTTLKGDGARAVNEAIEHALKSPGTSAASMKHIAEIAASLGEIKFGAKDRDVKEAIADAVKKATQAGDAEALKNLAANAKRMQDPAVAQELFTTATTAQAARRMGDLFSQPNPERVAFLRRQSSEIGDDFDAASLAKKAYPHDAKLAKFIGEEATPELLALIDSAKANSAKTGAGAVLSDGNLMNSKDATTVLQAANKYSGAQLENFFTEYKDARNHGYNATADRVRYADYRMKVASSSDVSAPTALNLADGKPWKVGQPIDDPETIGRAFNALGNPISHAGHRMSTALNEVRKAMRAGNATEVAKHLKAAYTEVAILNANIAHRGAGAGDEMAVQLLQLERQLHDLTRKPVAAQLAAVKESAK